MTTQTALILPLDPPDPGIEAFRASNDPMAAKNVPAHVSLLVPFVPLEEFSCDREYAVWRLLRDTPRFGFSLRQVARFPDATYLVPDPAGQIESLIERLVGAFPDHPPYEGAHDTTIPHLTVGNGQCLDAAVDEIPLPVTASASRALMLRQSGDRWKVHMRFMLGQA